MEKKNILVAGIFLLILVFIGAVGYQVYVEFKNGEGEENKDNGIQTVTKDNFTFESEYKGNTLWRYTIKGQLPNPCYKIVTDARVAESYPEQVSVTSTITSPKEDEMCTQVTQEVNEVGEFNASESATVSFQIVNK